MIPIACCRLVVMAFGCVVSVSWAFAATLADCSVANVRCVDDTAGATQEYSTIQAAVNAAQAGDKVQVYPGAYAGFQVTRSGTAAAPIAIYAAGAGVRVATPVSGSYGIFLSNVSYVTIEGFEIQGSMTNCIAARNGSPANPMRGLTIRNNDCRDAGHEGIYISEVSQSLIEGNRISGSGMNGATRGHGIYLANAGSDGTTLRGNIITNMRTDDSAAIHMNGDLSVGGDGLISGLMIENNILSAGRQNGLSMDGVQDSTIRNNLIYGMARNGMRGFQIDGAAGPKNLRIVNNTVVSPSGGGWAVKLSEDGGGHVVFNNILLAEGSSGGALCVDNAGITSDNNVVTNRMSRNNESSVITLASWQAGGDDAQSKTATGSVLFTNAAAGDYTLKAGAPAIDAGRASLGGVSAPAVDLTGASRPAGSAPDVGAYESGASGGVLCDVNRSGATDVVDVQLAVNQALGTSGCTADINRDNRCDVVDVQRVVNAVLGGACMP